MDEATSNVDVASEKLVQAALSKVFENSTVITVAHRLNTVLHADLYGIHACVV
jgi:ABC-type multidrug transport system fused ATPase/permease subunit